MRRRILMLPLALAFLAALLLLSAGTASSQTCTSSGEIRSYLSICDCTDEYFQTYGCPGTGSPECDPLRDFILCGTDGDTECYVPKASNQFCSTNEMPAPPTGQARTTGRNFEKPGPPKQGSSAVGGALALLLSPSSTAKVHICPDNSELKAWLQMKQSRRVTGTASSSLTGAS